MYENDQDRRALSRRLAATDWRLLLPALIALIVGLGMALLSG